MHMHQQLRWRTCCACLDMCRLLGLQSVLPERLQSAIAPSTVSEVTHQPQAVKSDARQQQTQHPQSQGQQQQQLRQQHSGPYGLLDDLDDEDNGDISTAEAPADQQVGSFHCM